MEGGGDPLPLSCPFPSRYVSIMQRLAQRATSAAERASSARERTESRNWSSARARAEKEDFLPGNRSLGRPATGRFVVRLLVATLVARLEMSVTLRHARKNKVMESRALSHYRALKVHHTRPTGAPIARVRPALVRLIAQTVHHRQRGPRATHVRIRDEANYSRTSGPG